MEQRRKTARFPKRNRRRRTMRPAYSRESVVFVTHYDARRISLLTGSASKVEPAVRTLVSGLSDKIRRAVALPPQAIPENIITLDSRFRLRDLAAGESRIYTLVMPKQADITQNRISILSPLGACVYGHATGDEVACLTPTGVRRLRIGAILYQPEANGLDLSD